MSKTFSLFSALFCTLIWGTTFIAQDTGMDKIGPLTFNGARFFIGFLFIIPIALIYENSKIIKQINSNKHMTTNNLSAHQKILIISLTNSSSNFIKYGISNQALNHTSSRQASNYRT